MSNTRLTRSIAAATALLAMTGGTFTTAAGATLEEVVVTARKREESLQEIPVAASVFSAAALEMRSATDVADLTASAPSVSYQDRAGGHQTSISIRGIASDVRNIGIDDSVGVYVDGVYIGRPMFYNVDLAEVAQVELLRGPQGTLFGKNTIAGALNITTKAVPEEFEGKLTFSAGADGLRYGKGYFGGMFTDTVGGSLSVVNKQTDGFMTNTTTGQKLQAVDQQGVAGKLLITGDNYDLVLTADYSEKDNDVNASQIIIPGGSGLGRSFGNEEGGLFGEQYGLFTVEEDGPQGYEEEVSGFAANLTVGLASDYELNLIAATRSMDLFATFDDDNTGTDLLASFFTDEADQMSLEARITSPSSETFEWIAGAYYFDQEVESNRQTAALGGTLNVYGEGEVNTTSTAFYFSGDYHITDVLDLNVGVRFTKDEKDALWDQFGNGAGAFGLPVIQHTGDESWEEVSPTVALTYALSDDATVYVKFAEGFKGGGYMTDLVGEEGFALEPETVESYEVGLKSTLLDSTLRLNVAAYRMDYTDLQTLDLSGLQFVGANAGE
ncbi:TonB-dependent receptor, partial [Porticoccaceae bacterium]|nr:TonB-dependent receptor [Porticoccaceae bacterium]